MTCKEIKAHAAGFLNAYRQYGVAEKQNKVLAVRRYVTEGLL